MKKKIFLCFLLSVNMIYAGYYLKGQKPSGSSSDKPVVVGGGFHFKGENAERVIDEVPREKQQNRVEFIHPMDFKGTEEEKQKVINYIKARVKKDLEYIDMYNNQNARMMERQELDSFKALTQAKDRQLMDRVIKELIFVEMLNYTNLKNMYIQEIQASQQELTW